MQDPTSTTLHERSTAPPELIEGEPSPQSRDTVARLAETVGAIHPYLLVDVECYHQDLVCDLREEAAKVCKDLWHKEAVGDGKDTLPLPVPQSCGAAVCEGCAEHPSKVLKYLLLAKSEILGTLVC